MDAPTTKPGSLIIVGTGIESIGQMTLQALAHIEAADKVFYGVADPATEAFILNKNKNSVDLYQYYDNGKPRMDTYVQMAELMLREVRAGLDIVGVFYGHPGVFVSPSHRALAIAKEEGFKARMLPGISAEDCLYADLGIDPAKPGCLIYEASDFVIAERPTNLHSHLILFQVGCVGIADFRFTGFENTKLNVLIDRLEREYGADHPVVHYIAAVLPHQDPVTDKLTIAQLRDPQIAKDIGGVSTFYIPPKDRKAPNAHIVRELELVQKKHYAMYPPNQWELKQRATLAPYDANSVAAIDRLKTHVVPEQYSVLATSKAMVDVMTQLALDPKALAKYKTDPHGFVRSVPELSMEERTALESGDDWAIRCAMRKTPVSLLESADKPKPAIHPFCIVDIAITSAAGPVMVTA